MKAVIAEGNGKINMAEVPVPELGPKDVLCKVVFSGICGTDIAIITGDTSFGERGWLKYPVRIGHEWSGIVEKVGANVHTLKPGDRVVSETCWSCYDCPECWEAKHCTHARALGTINDHWPGCHADYEMMPEQGVHKIDDSISFENACLFEPAAIAMDGIEKIGLKYGDTLLVTGTGPIGLTGVGLAKAMGMKVIVTGRRDSKLEYAKKMGADYVINVKKENLKEVLNKITPHGTVDGVLEATGNQEVLNELNSVVAGGRIGLAGFFEKDFPSFDLDQFILNGNSLMGVAGGTGVLPRMMKLVTNAKVDFTPLISSVYDFADAEAAFQHVIENDGNRIKVLLKH